MNYVESIALLHYSGQRVHLLIEAVCLHDEIIGNADFNSCLSTYLEYRSRKHLEVVKTLATNI